MSKKKNTKILVDDPKGSDDNQVQPFQIEGMDVRGRAVRLGTEIDGILTTHNYPEPVSKLLGEMLAMASLLGSFLKFDGIMTIQTKGDGPVNMLVADYMSPGTIRGYARFDEDALKAMGDDVTSGALLGKGHMAMTIDQGKDMERYQGIVELTGADISEAAKTYFLSSEQTPTALKLSAGRDPVTNHWRAGGIMVQHLSRSEEGKERLEVERVAEGVEEAWDRVTILMETVKPVELMDRALSLHGLLFRLYHEDGVRVFDPIPIKRGCRCSEDKIRDVIATFPQDDIDHMLEDDGVIRADCEFCGAVYEIKP